MTHMHITTWVLALILFFVALALQKSGNAKGQKIVHMILRLFYLLAILTGGMLIDSQAFSVYPVQYVLKMVFGILVIGFMEMVLVRTKKEKKTSMFWILLLISLLVVLYLGFSLPMGFNFFG